MDWLIISQTPGLAVSLSSPSLLFSPGTGKRAFCMQLRPKLHYRNAQFPVLSLLTLAWSIGPTFATVSVKYRLSNFINPFRAFRTLNLWNLANRRNMIVAIGRLSTSHCCLSTSTQDLSFRYNEFICSTNERSPLDRQQSMGFNAFCLEAVFWLTTFSVLEACDGVSTVISSSDWSISDEQICCVSSESMMPSTSGAQATSFLDVGCFIALRRSFLVSDGVFVACLAVIWWTATGRQEKSWNRGRLVTRHRHPASHHVPLYNSGHSRIGLPNIRLSLSDKRQEKTIDHVEVTVAAVAWCMMHAIPSASVLQNHR